MGEQNKVMEIQKVMEKSWNLSTAYRESRMRNADNSISKGPVQWFGYTINYDIYYVWQTFRLCSKFQIVMLGKKE